METKYQITDGPGKFDLSVALFHGRSKSDYVDFTVDDPDGGKHFLITATTINTVQREDGSRESWNIEGYCMLPDYKDSGRPTHPFKAYFHTQHRHGHIIVTMQTYTVFSAGH
jgi:hypothetical protein